MTIGLAEALRPLPRRLAPMVVREAGLVGRLVAWLARLAPRRKRVALPRVRIRVSSAPTWSQAGAVPPTPAQTRPDAAAEVPPPGGAVPAAECPVGEDRLAPAQLAELADEIVRLRAELAELKAGAAE